MTFRQPNSNYCFVCGRDNPRGLYMTFWDDGEGKVWSEHVIPDIYQGYPGIVHGGVQSAILDEIIGRVSLIGDPHHFMVAAKMEVRFRQPVPTDTLLRVEAQLEFIRGGRGRARGEIVLPNGSVGSEASLLLVDLPEDVRTRAINQVLGWRVDH